MKLIIDNLNFSYTEHSLFKNFSLFLDDDSRIVALLGPSGCGKTTLLHLIAGLLAGQIPPTKSRFAEAGTNKGEPSFPMGGTIIFESGPITTVSYVFQQDRLFPWYTVYENVMLVVQDLLPPVEAAQRTRRMLELGELWEYRHRYPRHLSGGQRQRVALARAFVYPAPLILMDEPFQSLDIPLRIQLMRCIQLLQREDPRHIIMVTHDPREAIFLSDRIIVLTEPPVQVALDMPNVLNAEERSYQHPASAQLEARLYQALSELPSRYSPF
ncbi:MAG: ABC transporter ATP-binding protein [Breznakiellaceae bacterium]|jgi:NitT/TauT family transport system ATP-binding protein